MIKLLLSISAAVILSSVVFMTVISAQAKPAHSTLPTQVSVVENTSHTDTLPAKSVPVIEADNRTEANIPSDNVPAIVPTTEAAAQTAPDTSARDDFARSLNNQQAEQVVGVYVPSVLALQVIQQPANNPAYVDATADSATQFGLAAQYGTTGLLAHNYLSGRLFFKLSVGQEVDIIYGDGVIDYYKITSIRHFQAINPTSPSSNFLDIDAHNNLQISNADLFDQIYNRGSQVVFQTCIYADGNASWGRLFVIAKPIP